MSKTVGVLIQKNLNYKATSQAGTEYDAYQLVYRNERGEIKDWTKPVTGLKYKPALKKAIDALEVNDEFTLITEKNAKGFLDLMDVIKGKPPETVTSLAAPAPAAAPASNGYKSTYETPQERADKQRYIVRQSTLSLAVEVLTASKGKLDPEAIKALATDFENYVFRKHVDDLTNDIPE